MGQERDKDKPEFFLPGNTREKIDRIIKVLIMIMNAFIHIPENEDGPKILIGKGLNR